MIKYIKISAILTCTLLVLFRSSNVMSAVGKSNGSENNLKIIFTGDLHGHIENFAKLATAIKSDRNENTVLIDDGDWAEVSPQYMMYGNNFVLDFFNKNQYDAVVLGNHDYYSGIDHTIDSLNKHPYVTTLCANCDFRKIADKKPNNFVNSKIVKKGKYKVGIIGLTASDIVYDYFAMPMRITPPMEALRNEINWIKDKTDFIVVLSHNKLALNESIAALAGINFIVGGHDHKPIEKPIVFKNVDGNDRVISNAGSYGKKFGVCEFENVKGKFVNKYCDLKLVQNYAEDTETKKWVAGLEKELLNFIGDDFDKVIATSKDYFERKAGVNSDVGNLLTDLYVESTGADLALEQDGWINADIEVGPITKRMVFNVFPHVYNFKTKKTWTIKVLSLKGYEIKKLMNILINLNSTLPNNGTCVSGNVRIEYIASFDAVVDDSKKAIKSFKINGSEIEPGKTYKMAVSEMSLVGLYIVKAISKINIKVENIEDSQKEIWKVVLDHFIKTKEIKHQINKVRFVNIGKKDGKIKN